MNLVSPSVNSPKYKKSPRAVENDSVKVIFEKHDGH